MAAHDWFDFGRTRGANMLWTEDWWAPAHWWSFQGSKLAAAGALSGLPWGAYVIPRARALQEGDMVQRVATIVGSGGKQIIYYNFGPDYMFPGNCWSRNTSGLSTEIAAAHALLAKAEPLLWAGRRPSATIAILAPRSASKSQIITGFLFLTCSKNRDLRCVLRSSPEGAG